MEYRFARKIAIDTGLLLMPHCVRLNIAGSVRRKKAEVKDIELVAIPKTRTLQTGLFDSSLTTVVSPDFVAMLESLGEVIKGKPDGRYMQIQLHEGIALDLFMPDPVDYFRQYCIRTGSADYSAKVIAGGWKKLGWCGSDKGLRKIADCQNRASGGKMNWICVNPDAELPPVWSSEEEFFDWLQIPWIKPELRNV
ncbi:hypothetical protein [Spirosoma sp.]|uniref:hypothetical protein n=1 Tax=Spirosoma sp. TaxID=1899569 RepID=UPI00262C714F|nr:hypothetical protein [Spirosoma sp.]MCX6217682.1 hypothetical protein [Spirosoma sp.]